MFPNPTSFIVVIFWFFIVKLGYIPYIPSKSVGDFPEHLDFDRFIYT